MTRINAVRSNAVRNTHEAHSVSWGTISSSSAKWGKNTSALIFAAVLIVCSLTVGCSSSNNNDKPKLVTTNNPIPVTQNPIPAQPAPVTQAATKSTPKELFPKSPQP